MSTIRMNSNVSAAVDWGATSATTTRTTLSSLRFVVESSIGPLWSTPVFDVKPTMPLWVVSQTAHTSEEHSTSDARAAGCDGKPR
jgi:hypothetical protein